MKSFYTVDRAGSLRPGEILSLQDNEVSDEPFRSFLGQQYVNGISRHGKEYIENPARTFDDDSSAVELYFEEVRRAHYPHLPSRFLSMFACESISDAFEMAVILDRSDAPVFEVKVFGDFHRANMSLLNRSGSILTISHRAHDYWRGEKGIIDQKPIWEIIAKLPVEVGQRVR